MANLIITEYEGIVQHGLDAAPQVPGRIVAVQSIAIGASSTAGSVFNARTAFVRLFAESKCSVAFDVNPTATATSQLPIGAEQLEYQSVEQGHKPAVIQR